MNLGDRDPQRLSALRSRAVGGVWCPQAVRLMHCPGRLLVVGAGALDSAVTVLPFRGPFFPSPRSGHAC